MEYLSQKVAAYGQFVLVFSCPMIFFFLDFTIFFLIIIHGVKEKGTFMTLISNLRLVLSKLL